MGRLTIEALGALLKKKRGERSLREISEAIGVSAPTLMRIENGRTPDILTFGKICKWLEVDPGEVLGVNKKDDKPSGNSPLYVSAHFRAEKNPNPETAKALAQMILHAAGMQPQPSKELESGAI